MYILAIIYITFEGCILEHCCFVRSSTIKLKTFQVGSGVHISIIKLIVVTVDFYYMLFLAAVTKLA